MLFIFKLLACFLNKNIFPQNPGSRAAVMTCSAAGTTEPVIPAQSHTGQTGRGAAAIRPDHWTRCLSLGTSG